MTAQQLRYTALLAAFLGITSGIRGAEPPARQYKPMDWQEARAALRAAGSLVAKKEFKPADGYLSYYQQELSAPYKKLISAARLRIAAFAKKTEGLDEYEFKGQLAALCMQLGAHRPALQLAGEIRKLRPGDPRGYTEHEPWCLLETGRVKEAAREYKRRPRLSGDRQLELAAKLHSGRDGADVLIAYVQEHYVRARGDHLGALDKLTVSLGRPHSSAARVAIYTQIFGCLAALKDSRGLAALEKRFLKRFSRNQVAASVVHMHRARRAAGKQDYDSAVSSLAEVMSAEVRPGRTDALTRAFVDRRHRAALLASEYCEKRKYLQRALDYAVAARDEYKPWRKTGANAAIAARQLAVRVRELTSRLAQARAKREPKPSPCP